MILQKQSLDNLLANEKTYLLANSRLDKLDLLAISHPDKLLVTRRTDFKGPQINLITTTIAAFKRNLPLFSRILLNELVLVHVLRVEVHQNSLWGELLHQRN